MDMLTLFYQMLATGFAIGGFVVTFSLRCAPDENKVKFDGVRFHLPMSAELIEPRQELFLEKPPLSFPNRLAA
jgi:hypothetical protein